jgi:hypothetical protein
MFLKTAFAVMPARNAQAWRGSGKERARAPQLFRYVATFQAATSLAIANGGRSRGKP